MSRGVKNMAKHFMGLQLPQITLWSRPRLGRSHFSYERDGGFLAEQMIPEVGQAGEMEEMSWKDQCMR